MRLIETLEVRSNLIITARERGKIRARREGHNIWVNLGRVFLPALMSCVSFDPDVPERQDRIKYLGFGIGGTRQTALGIANAPPLLDAYPGSNTQTDTDPTIASLERPARISGSVTRPSDPYDPTDVWLGRIQAPAAGEKDTERTYRRLFTQTELSYSSFTVVPLSEVGLFTSAASPIGQPHNTFVAYDTFDTISKTSAIEIEVAWTVRF